MFGVFGLVRARFHPEPPAPSSAPRPGVPPPLPVPLHSARCPTPLCRARQTFIGLILSMGGEWYLGVPEENASSAATACFAAAFFYLLYLIGCGMRVQKELNRKGDAELLEDEE